MRRVIATTFCCCLLLSLAGCGAYSASLSAHSYVSSKTTWTYESMSVTGQAILKLSDGLRLVLPADHHFQKQFKEDKTGTFLYCSNCSGQAGEVGAYLAPNDETTRKVLDARGYISGSGL